MSAPPSGAARSRNQVSGTVSGNVVQAHGIHGNVTFGDVPRRDA